MYKKDKNVLLLAILANILLYYFIIKTKQYDIEKNIVVSFIFILLTSLIYLFKNRLKINLATVFLLSFIIFQFGQPLVYMVNKNYFYGYMLLYGEDELIYSIRYSTISILMFLLGISIIDEKKEIRDDFLTNNKDTIRNNSRWIFLIIYLIAFGFSLISFSVSKKSGYLAAIVFENRFKFFANVSNTLVTPLYIALFLTGNKKDKLYYSLLVIFLGLLNAISGFRTVGVALIMVSGILYIFTFNKISAKRKDVLKKTIIIVFASLMLLFLISFIQYYRMPNSRGEFKLSFDFALSAIHEMGYNFNSLTMTKNNILELGGFQNGKTYLYSILSMFPSSLDPTGLVSMFSEKAIYDIKLTRVMGYNYGVGFSLIAESYLNFGNYGCFIFIPIGAFLAKFMNVDKNNIVSMKNFSAIIMFYMAITTSRRQMYNVLNSFGYAYIYFPLVIRLIGFKNKNVKLVNYRTRNSVN